jgi:hypothetical protein
MAKKWKVPCGHVCHQMYNSTHKGVALQYTHNLHSLYKWLGM